MQVDLKKKLDILYVTRRDTFSTDRQKSKTPPHRQISLPSQQVSKENQPCQVLTDFFQAGFATTGAPWWYLSRQTGEPAAARENKSIRKSEVLNEVLLFELEGVGGKRASPEHQLVARPGTGCHRSKSSLYQEQMPLSPPFTHENTEL